MKAAATLDNGSLILENKYISRKWALSPAGPRPISLNAFGTEWQVEGAEPREASSAWSLKTASDEDGVRAELTGPDRSVFRFQMFDSIPGFTCVPPDFVPVADSSRQSVDGVEERVSEKDAKPFFPEEWFPAASHLKLIRFVLQDKSDRTDNLFRREEYRVYPNENLRLRGNLFAVENSETGSGILYLKHAPLPDSRPEISDFDIEFSPGGWCAPKNRRPVHLNRDGYPWTLLAYSGGQSGITCALQAFLHAKKPYRPGIDGMILSNTWGDRNKDMALSEAFLLNEIELAKEIGVDVCQIDDGWQSGVTANSGIAARHNGGAWNGNYHKAGGAFWLVNAVRFPHGLAPLAELCRKTGVGLGLWFSPDSANEFEYWKEDSEILLNFNREYGVCWFKIDGISVATRKGTERLQEFFRRTSERSDGGIAFDLDVTAGRRPGYFGLDYPGALFLENRYSDSHSWWPYATFRNLWSLSSVMPPVHLRIELLNPDRNTGVYEDDVLAPVNYKMDWIFASVMVASPLLWCELHGLSAERKTELKNIIPLWKEYRKELHTSTVYPVGEQPDGFRWSGYFTSGSGVRHLIAFRDCARESEYTFELPGEVSGEAVRLYGTGALIGRDGKRITVRLPERRSFMWFRFA